MQACFILLTLAVGLSAPQQQTQTVNQRLEVIGDWLEKWKKVSLDTLQLLLANSFSEDTLAFALAEVSDRVI